MNAVAILRDRNKALKRIVGGIKESEGEALQRKLNALEEEVRELRRTGASKSMVEELRADVVGGEIGDLNKAVKRQERRGELVRLTLGEASSPFPDRIASATC